MCTWCTPPINIVILCGSHLSKLKGTSSVWNYLVLMELDMLLPLHACSMCSGDENYAFLKPWTKLYIKFKTYALETSNRKRALLFQFCKHERKTWRRALCGYMRSLCGHVYKSSSVFIFIPVQLLQGCPHSIKHLYVFEGGLQVFTPYRCTLKDCLYRCNPALKQNMQTNYCWIIVLG